MGLNRTVLSFRREAARPPPLPDPGGRGRGRATTPTRPGRARARLAVWPAPRRWASYLRERRFQGVPDHPAQQEDRDFQPQHQPEKGPAHQRTSWGRGGWGGVSALPGLGRYPPPKGGGPELPGGPLPLPPGWLGREEPSRGWSSSQRASSFTPSSRESASKLTSQACRLRIGMSKRARTFLLLTGESASRLLTHHTPTGEQGRDRGGIKKREAPDYQRGLSCIARDYAGRLS